MLIFATADDLAAWLPSTVSMPDDPNSLLRSASLLIAEATNTSYYDTVNQDDPTNLNVIVDSLPSDPTILQAFNDATCAQATAWLVLGINPATGGVIVSATKTSVGIGSGRITYADAAAAASARAESLTTLVPEAERVLRAVGLITSHAWSYG